MGRVTLDPALSTELGASTLPVEVCDPSGKTLGFFVPSQAFYAFAKSPNSEEELRRRDLPAVVEPGRKSKPTWNGSTGRQRREIYGRLSSEGG